MFDICLFVSFYILWNVPKRGHFPGWDPSPKPCLCRHYDMYMPSHCYTVADPGFPREGGANPKGGRQPIICRIFPENCMKMKKFWAGGGRASLAPLLRSATDCNLKHIIKDIWKVVSK